MEKVKTSLDWKWSENVKPMDKPIDEILADARKEFLEKEGRLYTTEEVITLVDEIRKELYKKG